MNLVGLFHVKKLLKYVLITCVRENQNSTNQFVTFSKTNICKHRHSNRFHFGDGVAHSFILHSLLCLKRKFRAFSFFLLEKSQSRDESTGVFTFYFSSMRRLFERELIEKLLSEMLLGWTHISCSEYLRVLFIQFTACKNSFLSFFISTLICYRWWSSFHFFLRIFYCYFFEWEILRLHGEILGLVYVTAVYTATGVFWCEN